MPHSGTSSITLVKYIKSVLMSLFYIILNIKLYIEAGRGVEAGRGAAARGVTAKATGCGFDSHSRR